MKLSERLNTIEESATLALNTKAKELAAEGKKIYNFTAGEPSANTPEYIKEYLAGKLDQNHYTPVPGIPELREAIAEHAKEFYSSEWIKNENVMVVAGGKPGLYLSLLALINPGDEVILPTPAWVSYKYIVELAGGTVAEARLTDNFDLDIANIEAAITDKTKVVIINSPNNPTGSIYSPDSLKKLSELLANTSVTVLADDMYTKLVYDTSFEPITKYGFKNLIISSGFSKSQVLTGWRVGYVIAKPEIIKALTKMQSHLLGNTSNLSQYAAMAGLARGDKPAAYEALKANLEIVNRILKTVPKIKYTPPAGAFYAFIDIRGISGSSMGWCQELLDKKGVALVPGEAFFAPGYVRLSFTTDGSTLEEGLEKIKEFIEESS
ncbi:MAG TPA: pyridoxal phosphate-dependent aminotransferase [Candidatus Saccharimonadales bacterium]|nr:pyridoxal phosphate-dependent aminotransferase [Candidatus Saccharimonadales bacterium]